MYSSFTDGLPNERLYLWSTHVEFPSPADYTDIVDYSSITFNRDRYIKGGIEEPDYYAQLRELHEKEWRDHTSSHL